MIRWSQSYDASWEYDSFYLQTSALYFCTHFANVNCLDSFIETLYPTLKTQFPTISSADVWHAPDHHQSHQTLDDLLFHSTSTLSTLLQYSPYGDSDSPALPPPTIPSRTHSKSNRNSVACRSNQRTLPDPKRRNVSSTPLRRSDSTTTTTSWQSSYPSLSNTTLSTTPTDSSLQQHHNAHLQYFHPSGPGWPTLIAAWHSNFH